MKVVGTRNARTRTPEESLRRAERMIAEAKRLAQRAPRASFVVKFPTREMYDRWKRENPDPRYWW